jgi:hypothetical protein
MKRLVFPLAVAVVVASVALFVFSLPYAYRGYAEPCTVDSALTTVEGTEECENWGLTEAQFEQWTAMGSSPEAYAALATGRDILVALPYLLVGLVLLVRRRDDWFASFTAAVLVAFGLTSFGSATFQLIASGIPALLELTTRTLQWLGGAGLLLVVWMFPTGWFVPRWTAWLAPIWVLYQFDESLLPDFNVLPPVVNDNLFNVMVLTGIIAQVYRYRTTSDRVQRQQTKWVVYSVSTGLALFVLLILGVELLPILEGGSVVTTIFGETVVAASLAIIPLSIGLAILRYRLWDIDVIVRRTVTYAIVTALLALVYLAGVLGLPALIGSDSELIVALSTLAVAALFNPLRRRVQGFVERRFDRSRYDAGRVMGTFTARLRHEVDLAGLRADVTGVVSETLRPSTISLWVREEQQ